jgi:four helix bundle protein
MALIRSFEELDCWKVSTELRRELAVVIRTYPADEKYALISQIRRASRSVTNNLAEGFGRYHYQESIKFCRTSRGSLTELMDHLIIAADERYISSDQLVIYKSKIERCKALVNGFINYLKKAKDSGSKAEEPFLAYAISNNE